MLTVLRSFHYAGGQQARLRQQLLSTLRAMALTLSPGTSFEAAYPLARVPGAAGSASEDPCGKGIAGGTCGQAAKPKAAEPTGVLELSSASSSRACDSSVAAAPLPRVRLRLAIAAL
eukprot:2234957-Pleurochrysis_carterae.AAC.3